MITGKTESGFRFKIDEEATDDMELLENLVEFEKGQRALLPEMAEQLLGKEQKAKLYDYCRSESGRVSAKKVVEELGAIFKEMQKSPKLKNS